MTARLEEILGVGFMKCPYCDEEMEAGVIQSPHEISWTIKNGSLGE